MSIRKDITSAQRELFAKVLARVSEDQIKTANETLNSTDHQISLEFGEITHDKIVDLNYKLKKMILDLNRLEHKNEDHLQKALKAENVLEAKNAEDWAERTGKTPGCMSSLSYLWNCKIEQVFFLVIGILFVVFSVFAFFMEILSFLDISLFNLNNIIDNDDGFLKSQVKENFYEYI